MKPAPRRHLVAFALVLSLAGFATASRARTGEDPADRVGPDNGFALAVDYSGDLDGSLENCGCHHHPMGGFLWRAGYINAFVRATAGKVPLMQVDAGHSLSSVAGPSGLSDEARVRNDFVLRSFERLHVAAANVSYRDVAYLAERMREPDYAKNVKRLPALESFVSANLVPRDGGIRPFKPYVVREVSGARLGAKPLRVGFLGVSSGPTANGVTLDKLGAYRIGDPVEAAKKYAPELRAKCDVLVVLAYVDRGMANRIGLEVPGIDVLLAANQFPLYNAVDEAGDAVVAFAANQTKWLGEIRLFTSDGGTGSAISHYEHRDVALDGVFPDDPTAVQLLEESRAEIAKTLPKPVPAAEPR